MEWVSCQAKCNSTTILKFLIIYLRATLKSKFPGLTTASGPEETHGMQKLSI